MSNWTPTVGGLIHEIDRLVKKRFDRFAETTGMSRAQWQVLARVAKRQGVNQATLADLVGVEPITICRMVDRLEALDLVERRPDPNDRRARLIHMTEAARPGLERMKGVAQALFAEALDGFTPEEEATLFRLLGRIHANLLADTDEEQTMPSPMSTDDSEAVRTEPDQKD
ncbi:MarR family transcriptional regulator [uncultured Pleomorphomonas sp.]|uniref:MarR family transcriptional regulator n=1 Tax=uncultured Pleomorphomonas sp. TaxID=442121 RepID=A0A212LGI9_9HYPH|nr:MarR family transcriptional regulator [uncultured Pleomorphomonas sp.]SCM76608.1 MarR family transcriptional regulator [uncultured Pleomorphomonas sp.]